MYRVDPDSAAAEQPFLYRAQVFDDEMYLNETHFYVYSKAHIWSQTSGLSILLPSTSYEAIANEDSSAHLLFSFETT